MVKFIDLDPANIDTSRIGSRGRVSYPIIKGFMERNVKLSQLDLEGLDKNPTYLRSVLTSYINSHNMPIRIFAANGELHLMRLDLNNDGTPNPNWQQELQRSRSTEGAPGFERDVEIVPLDANEVQRRYEQEKGRTTK